ncbi:protein kinase kin1 [Colletotrichum musicola]|uniref:non-specific serine/threonine protein kinase n=1 Tax=Colletotrichum musicola TaxID=2175873 RepID=A0A8H6MN52_9PEZI|nr:protein kinase kin1 [Colletotrichum musicola]
MTTATSVSSDTPVHAPAAPARSLSTRSRPSISASGTPPQRATSTSSRPHLQRNHTQHHLLQHHQQQHNHHRTHSRHHLSATAAALTTPAAAAASRSLQDIIPQHNYETTNVVPNPKRSALRDHPPSSTRADVLPPQRHDSTISNYHSSYHQSPPVPFSDVHFSDMPANTAVANNAGPAPVSHGTHDPRSPGASSAAKHSKSRTTIPTPSGKWILGKTIGAGSMGKVKLARKEDTGEQVACKIIPRGSTEDGHPSRADKERADQSKEIRTAREAAIVTLLSHPHICGMRDVVRTNYHWYMLCEYVNGGQMLDYIISHGKLKEKQARKFSRQIASALDYCHRNSIVHRDLKIENILISKTGDIKIIDFGLSNLFAPRGHLKTFCGSLYFAAPELLQARAYTGPEVDVWSFGIVLYVLVCGKVPFDDQSMPALHAKIKKGLVDYPNWLSSECKHLLSRMLVTDPRHRATMQEVMGHPWMTKGYTGPPDNHLPPREPLTLPLDLDVVNAMTGFNFGSPDAIRAQLTRTIESEEYQRAVRLYQREKELPPPAKDVERRRGFGFDFYKRRNSGNSRDTLTAPSSEALQLGNDPLNAYSPLISIYYLVREKQGRDHAERNTGALTTPKDRPPIPEITPPQEAHTNTAAYEMPGERATGGRSRPRARTHGEDDAPESAKTSQLSPTGPLSPEVPPEPMPKKESTAAGILRRFSTRRRKEPERLDKDRSHPPVVQVHSPAEAPPAPVPRKSFSIRRGRREREELAPLPLRSGSSQPQHSDLLSPPLSAEGSSRRKGLGRSTSVNSADLRRRGSNRAAKEPTPTSASDRSTNPDRTPPASRDSQQSRAASMRAKSLGHARRESIQRRRLRREEAREVNVPEETDQEQGDQSGVSTDRLDSSDLAKPVFLKGLFSVSTTSTKTVPEIRADIKRVLKGLAVDYTEIKGGFSCKHTPSIDLKKVQDPPGSPGQVPPGHRRRFSFGAIRGGDREREDLRDMDRGPPTPRGTGRSGAESYSNSEVSVDSVSRETGGSSRRVPGETSTHVQSDLGGSMVLEFEIFIVKVPLLSLHGVQFKRLVGNTWQYKNMADQVLRELRL